MIRLYSIALNITSKLLNISVKLRLWNLASTILNIRKKYISVKLKQELKQS